MSCVICHWLETGMSPYLMHQFKGMGRSEQFRRNMLADKLEVVMATITCNTVHNSSKISRSAAQQIRWGE